MTAAAQLLAAHWPMLLLGATALLAAGAAALLLARSPIHRQRLAEMTVAAVLVWAVLACVPLPRWSVARDAASPALGSATPLPDTATDVPPPAASDLPADWRSALASLIRPAQLRQADRKTHLTNAHRDDPPSMDVPSAASPSVAPRRARSVAFGFIGAIAFLVGAGLCAGWLLLGHVLLWRVIRRAREPEPWLLELFSGACRAIGVRRARVLVVESPLRPVSCGLFRPTVLLGREDCTGDRPRVRQVLLHEAAHLRQRDAWGNALFNLAMPLLYVHPLYWLLRSTASLAREMVADDLASAATSRAAYAADLLELAGARIGWRPAPLAAVGIFRSPSHFYRRIHVLMHRTHRLDSRCSWPWKLISGAACGAVLLAACATLGVRQAAAQDATDKRAPSVQDPMDQQVRQAKQELDDAASPHDPSAERQKAGAVEPESLKTLGLMMAQLQGEQQVAKERYGVRSREFLDVSDKLKLLKQQYGQTLSQNEAPAQDANRRKMMEMIAQLKGEYDVAKERYGVDSEQAKSTATRLQAVQDSLRESQERAVSTREQRAIERRAQLQVMQATEQRKSLEEKLKWSEADVAKLQAQLAQLQQEVQKARAQEAQARAVAQVAVAAASGKDGQHNENQGTSSSDKGQPDRNQLGAAVSGLRPQLDLVALANSYADAMGNVTVARQELDAAERTANTAAAKAKLAAAEQKARLFRAITQAALAQAQRELAFAEQRYKLGIGDAGVANEAEGRVHILSLILSSGGEQHDPARP